MTLAVGEAYVKHGIGLELAAALTGGSVDGHPAAPSSYNAPEELKDAFLVSLVQRRPLLLTGLPGVGKTTFAEHVATAMGLELEVFNVKTRTEGREFLYAFDEVGRFRDANDRMLIENGGLRGLVDYVTLQGLGLAILRAIGPDVRVHLPDTAQPAAQPHLQTGRSLKQVLGREPESGRLTLGDIFPGHFPTGDRRPRLTVVLIDEIDKAPRDTPNDLLDELDRMRFDIREAGIGGLSAPQLYRPIVIITSNNERQLPPAFLRRCTYHHLELKPDRLQEILLARLRGPDGARLGSDLASRLAERLTAIFRRLNEQPGLAERRPGTAEFLGAAAVLLAEPDRATLTGRWGAASSLGRRLAAVLAKTNDEMADIRQAIDATEPAGLPHAAPS